MGCRDDRLTYTQRVHTHIMYTTHRVQKQRRWTEMSFGTGAAWMGTGEKSHEGGRVVVEAVLPCTIDK